MKKQAQYVTAFLLTASVLTGLLTGCSRASHDTSAYAEATYAYADFASAKVARSNNSSTQTSVEAEIAYDAEYQAGGMGGAESPLTSTTSIQPVNSSRKMIRTVNLSVETTEFDQLVTSITTAVTGLNGYIEQSDISGNSISNSYNNQRYASLTVRVPSNQLDSFVAQVSQQGNITYKSESTQDVTLQYTDIESRKTALNVEQERLWELLAKAESIESVIALEQRLSEIRYQLESMESQLRTYDNQVDYSTIYLNVSEVKVFAPVAPDSVGQRIQKGFSANLEHVATGLINFFVWFISSLPSFVLLAVIVFLLWVIIHLIQKGRKKKGTELRHTKFRPFSRNKNQQQNQQEPNQQKSDQQDQ